MSQGLSYFGLDKVLQVWDAYVCFVTSAAFLAPVYPTLLPLLLPLTPTLRKVEARALTLTCRWIVGCRNADSILLCALDLRGNGRGGSA